MLARYEIGLNRDSGSGIHGLAEWVRPSETPNNLLETYCVAIKWNKALDPIRFIESGEEPDVGYEPFTPAPKIIHEPANNPASGV